jgi:putative spermidine/putrescine transport system permease protein
MPLLIAMQWLGVDPAGAQSARAAAKRKRESRRVPGALPVQTPTVKTAR